MLNRYIDFIKVRELNYEGNNYLLTLDGKMFEAATMSEMDHPLKATFIAVLFKQCFIPPSRYREISTLFLDGDKNNTSAANLILHYPTPLSMGNGFFNIPGFTRYSINTNGEVWSHCTNKQLSPYQDQSGYWMYGVTPDVGKRTIVGMHRLLALAFKQYPANVDELDVNHIDGVKYNCKLDNIEWASRKENCDHAYSCGLRDDNVIILVRDISDLTVSSYYSIEAAGRALGIKPKTVRWRAMSDGQTIYPDGRQYKRSCSITEWGTITSQAANGTSCPVTVTINDGYTEQYSSVGLAAKKYGFKSATVAAGIRNRGSFIKNGLVFKKYIKSPLVETLGVVSP